MLVEWAPGITISPVPLREVVRRSSPITNGWSRTRKNPTGFCECESRGELHFMMFAEMCPNITLIAPQPCEVPFSDGDVLRCHIPDFAVIERGESLLFEVKPKARYLRPDTLRRLRAAARSIEARGWPYYVALKEDILGEPCYDNVFDVWRRFRPSFTELQRTAVDDAVGTRERIVRDVLRDLVSTMGNEAPRFEDILSLAANGLTFIDVEAPIGEASVIRAADRAALPRPLLPRRRPADDLPWEAAV